MPARRTQDLLRFGISQGHGGTTLVEFPRLYLQSHGIDPSRDLQAETFVGSPRAVCAAVADGTADVGACFVSEPAADDPKRLLADVQRVYPAAAWRMRALGVTDPIPSDGIVVAGHVDADLQGRIRDAVLRFHRTADGRAALDKLLFADKLVPVTVVVARVIADLRARTPGPGYGSA
jgi:ABC-type phosphate/phosphonate transport system substrate-binding protein